MTPPPPGVILQFRKGSQVKLAVVAATHGDKVAAIDDDGRRLELPAGRILQTVGATAAHQSVAAIRERLRDLGEQALRVVSKVELDLLWELAREETEGATIAELVETYHGRSGSNAERLGLGFALCFDKVYFKQKGTCFQPRAQAEVEKRLKQREADNRAREARQSFLEWTWRALESNERQESTPPESGDLLGALEVLAVRGDEATGTRGAKNLLREISSGSSGRKYQVPPTAEGAFYVLKQLGVFSEHENLAVRRLAIPTVFPKDVVAASEAATARSCAPADDGQRLDLRTLETVTVDNKDTRDRDDAVSFEPLGDGGYRIGVHIADPTASVPMGSPLDDEAIRRGTSIYLATGRYPMLPPELSDDAVSLNAGKDRAAITLLATFDGQHTLVAKQLVPSVICVDRNLSYEEADEAMSCGEPHLAFIDALANRIRSERTAAGALDLNTFDRSIHVDKETWEVTIKIEDVRSPAHQAIGELMVLFNGTLAERFRANGVPAVYRRQAPPAGGVPDISAYPNRNVWANDVRRRLGRVEHSLEPGHHATLGVEAYVQGTSPIRRYQDLVHIRQLRALLHDEELPYSPAALREVMGATGAAVDAAMECARETSQYWILQYMSRRSARVYDAMVLGRTRHGRALVEIGEVGIRWPL
ncbi:ribonuclease catalytic domain-containing protein, partial [Planctomycetota bacterium]